MHNSDNKITAQLVQECCAEVRGLIGDAAEIGVYKGDSAELICRELPGSTVWLFDTFTGMPTDMLEVCDLHFAHAFKDTSVENVRARLLKYDNARIVCGVFPETARQLDIRLKFVHVDCDIYLSTLAALWWGWCKLVPGGVMLCDDYLTGSCPGALKAVEKFMATEDVKCESKLKRAIFRRQP